MWIYDQHLHSYHSFDSREDPEANVRAAIEKGLSGITFTEHFDTHPVEWPLCRYDYEAIRRMVDGLRRRYGDRLFIGHGVEVCYQPERMDFILDYLAGRQFDLVILSVHWFDGRALHVREHWDGLDPGRATALYLQTVAEAARTAGRLRGHGRRVFDVLGHLDLVKRYTHRFFHCFDVRSHAALVDEVLRTALEADLIPEVNTSGARQSVGEAMPAEWVVRRYAELGGTCMSVGSDAHKAADIGAGLPEAVECLRRCGVGSLAVFRDRELMLQPLA